MNKDHKINLQQQTILSLSQENQMLREHLAQLQTDAQAAEALPRQGYEKAKIMMEEMEKRILEYNLLLDEVRALKDAYTGQVTRMRRLISDYHTQIGGIL